MSIFIRVEQPGALPCLLRSRRAETVLTAANDGGLDLDGGGPSICVIRSRQHSAWAEPLSQEGIVLPRGSEPLLEWPERTHATIRWRDVTCHLYLTSPFANPLSQLEGADGMTALCHLTESIDDYPTVSVAVAGFVQSVPLIEAVPVTVGSGDEDGLVVPLATVAAHHCTVTRRESSLIVTPVNGSVGLSPGGRNDEEVVVAGSGTVLLLPVGLPLRWKSLP